MRKPVKIVIGETVLSDVEAQILCFAYRDYLDDLTVVLRDFDGPNRVGRTKLLRCVENLLDLMKVKYP